jgi:hypothetical protein
LEDVLNVLENPSPENTITLDPETQDRALQCVNEMFHYSSQ